VMKDRNVLVLHNMREEYQSLPEFDGMKR
jgi:hypothetical protein